MDTQRTNLDLLLIRDPGLWFVLGLNLVVLVGGIESGGRGGSEEVVGGDGRGRRDLGRRWRWVEAVGED